MVMGWDFETLKKVFEEADKEPKKKFFFTDSQEEFVSRMEGIAHSSFKQNKDNLRYLEQLDQIRRIRAGEKIEEVYTWLKRDMEC
jgi:hypothetical protein